MLVPRFAVALLVVAFADVAPTGGGGCRADEHTNATANTVHTLDGGTAETPACHAAPIDAAACSVEDGLPHFGYYDGCNWCSCTDGSRYCTVRGCPSGGTAFTPGDCNPVYWGVSSVQLSPGESWACDASGRLYRSACAPEGATPAVP